MIELLKLDGSLRKRAKLFADFTEATIAKAKSNWIEAQRAEYSTLYPEYTTEIVEDVETQVKCEYTHTFDSWLAEEYEAESAIEEVKDENGFVTSPAKLSVMKLIREFVAPVVTEDDLDSYLKTRYAELRRAEYPNQADYLDAIVKGDTEAQDAYIAKCQAVKEKYPKA